MKQAMSMPLDEMEREALKIAIKKARRHCDLLEDEAIFASKVETFSAALITHFQREMAKHRG
jgi:hypothetical protein